MTLNEDIYVGYKKYLLQYILMSQNKKEEKKEEKSSKEGGNSFNQSIEVAKQVKELMKDFYKEESSSSIDFQRTIKDRGFSFLDSNVQEEETIAELEYAQEMVESFLDNLKMLLSPSHFKFIDKFFRDWRKARLRKFKKMEIMFSTNTTSNAAFIGAYYKRTEKEIYLCYKVVKNAFKLAPDIYVVTETQSESMMWGAFSSSSKRDSLMEVNRGFKKEDLAVLMEIASVSMLDLDMVKELQ